ncbi:hypothetical protein PRUPE_4G175200 [Prunus persica]|uniref:non-specific serine/threonine protein kinase n=1 Tax=Prunus persica TaxID=3760 RepID=A0A251PM19_PRUPE|nr:hypothetical protein PRUPE_4G175200 [Prunus persica]
MAQNATADPSEVAALISIFKQWDMQALPVSGGEQCIGFAINGSDRVHALNKRGVFPKEFEALRYLAVLKLDLNYFIGPLPAFIGNMSALTELGNLKELTMLSFGSNNFSGTLPPELGNLVNLRLFYASDNPFSGKIPSFIGNWRKLTSLRSQGNSFEGPIPTSFSQLTSLESLRSSDIYYVSSSLDFITDLVLRNTLINGSIPTDFGEYQCLQILFLGNNSLSGPLPSQKSNQLQTIDLSYNYFSGSFPPWVTTILQLLPRLNCLQRNFPCNRNTPRYHVTAIGIAYLIMYTYCRNVLINLVSISCAITSEAEDSALGPATFNVTSTQKWAVSNAGFSDNLNQSFVETTLTQVFGADLTPELFETSRVSPGSLRYYGLGLQNGPYTVTLQFAETGNLRRKDFDISKEVGGVNRAVPRPFKVNVTENYLDIHLSYTNYSRKEEQDGLIVGIAVPVGVVILLLLSVLYMRRKTSEKDDDEVESCNRRFNPSNKLGEGGYGPVYKGTLSDGRVAAVKQLSVASHQGKSQFVTEIAMISAVQYRNLVKLYGCCIEGSRRILIYEYLENKSLDQALFGRNDLHLNWPTCFNILLGTARGLAYLHEESMPRIIRRDVKASSILLDAELSPKISDFGWAKLYDDEKTHMITRVAGTIGYLAPENAMRGHLTEKADVFWFRGCCFGDLSGRPNSDNNLDPEKIYLLEWVGKLSLATFVLIFWSLEPNRSLTLFRC